MGVSLPCENRVLAKSFGFGGSPVPQDCHLLWDLVLSDQLACYLHGTYEVPRRYKDLVSLEYKRCESSSDERHRIWLLIAWPILPLTSYGILSFVWPWIHLAKTRQFISGLLILLMGLYFNFSLPVLIVRYKCFYGYHMEVLVFLLMFGQWVGSAHLKAAFNLWTS